MGSGQTSPGRGAGAPTDQLREENRKLSRLLSVQRRLGGERDIHHLIPLVMEEATLLMDADRSAVFLLDWDRLEMRSMFAQGLDGGQEITIPLRMGVVGCAVLQKRVINVVDAYNTALFNQQVDQITGYKTETLLAAPVFDWQGRLLGAVELLNKESGIFSDHDEATLSRAVAELAEEADFLQRDREWAAGVIHGLTDACGCERGTLFLFDPERGRLYARYAMGVDPAQGLEISINLGVAGVVAFTGKALNIPDAYASPLFNREVDRATGYRTRSLLAAPVFNQHGEIIGVVEVINKNGDGVFDAEDERTIQSLSAVVGIALENAILLGEYERQFNSVLAVMAASIDAKDPLTAGHSLRVSALATGLAREVGLPEEEVDVVRIAALLHDYGKLAIQDDVLKKPGKLNAQEYATIQTHVTHTREILDKMQFSRKYRNVPIIASAHHEYMDGTGYDAGLKNRYIPFMSKIITVADVFEALTAERHYRTAMPLERALGVLQEGAGSKFDPAIVAALARYLVRHPEMARSGPSLVNG